MSAVVSIHFKGVWRSCCVPNFAISLLRRVTIAFYGSLIVDVVGLAFKTCNPGASASYNPSRFFFERRFPCVLRANFTSTARSGKSIGLHSEELRNLDSTSVRFLSRSLASLVALVIPFSTSISLL